MSIEEFGTSKSPNASSLGHGIESNDYANTDLFERDISSPRQWVFVDSDKYSPIGKTVNRLPSKVFTIKINPRNESIIFCEIKITSDSLVRFKNSIIDSTIDEIENFWNKDKEFSKYGFTHHRGYLLYGPAGGGKTSLLHLIIDEAVKRNSLVFICDNPRVFIEAVREFRRVEPNRNVICVFEDIDSIIRKYGDEELLQYLDGDFNIDKVLNVATTNYPEVLDKRIVGRPRRFDRIIKIGYPDEDMRKQYFGSKLKKNEVEKWVKGTKGLSFAALAELIISVKCLDKDFDKSIELLRGLQSKEVSSGDKDEETRIGFSK